MPIDPQLLPIIELLGGTLPVVGKDAAEVRAMLSGGAPRRDDGLRSVEDITVAGGLPARIYRAEGTPSPEPVLVFFHGGGWVIGGIDSHDATCASIAADSGVTVISIDYRLAPEHKFPAAVDDAFGATVWVAEHAAELGVDPQRLAVGGDSAGGNLAAVVALLARDDGGPAIAYQLLVYPATDHTQTHPSIKENGALGYVLGVDTLEWFREQYLGGAGGFDEWRASPLHAHRFDDLPPAFVITAELDPLRDEGEAYAERLRAAGVPTRLERAPGMCHGFYAFPIDESRRIHEEITTELRKALLP